MKGTRQSPLPPVNHLDLPLPARKGKDGTSLVVRKTRDALKGQGKNVTEKQVWEVYHWWMEFIKRVIEDGTAERIQVPYLGNFSPKRSAITADLWEALPEYVRATIKTHRIKAADLLTIFSDPDLSAAYITEISKLPKFLTRHDFLFSPNNKPKQDVHNTGSPGVRPGVMDSQAEPAMAHDDTGDEDAHHEGQGL